MNLFTYDVIFFENTGPKAKLYWIGLGQWDQTRTDLAQSWMSVVSCLSVVSFYPILMRALCFEEPQFGCISSGSAIGKIVKGQ